MKDSQLLRLSSRILKCNSCIHGEYEWVCECLLWIFNGHALLSFCAFFVQKKRLQTDETDREEDARRWQRSCARSKWKVKAKWAINDAYRLSIVVVVVAAWVIGQEEKRLQIDRGKDRKREGKSRGANDKRKHVSLIFWPALLTLQSPHTHLRTP